MSTSQTQYMFLAKDATGKLHGIPGQEIGAATVPAYTVAALPSGIAGAIAFATNGCAFTGTVGGGSMNRENTGAGTGCLVTYNGTAWKIAGTNVTVTA